MNYYNDNDPFAAAWLRQLVGNGYLPAGHVDDRSIVDVKASDVRGYTQCHFFAGIGGWPLALDLAGWGHSRPVWTGSCPCQPFSGAGEQRGFNDERHLWPAFFDLIRECRPAVCFGEQVASKAGLEWFDLVQADMEGAGYACTAVDLSAACVGAPHIRQRLYWVGDAQRSRLEGQSRHGNDRNEPGLDRTLKARSAATAGPADGMADAAGSGRQPGPWVAGVSSEQILNDTLSQLGAYGFGSRSYPIHRHWERADWLYCRDGKWRPAEPGLEPLADGISNRVGRLRGYGNAIVPQVAAQVISAFMDIR